MCPYQDRPKAKQIRLSESLAQKRKNGAEAKIWSRNESLAEAIIWHVFFCFRIPRGMMKFFVCGFEKSGAAIKCFYVFSAGLAFIWARMRTLKPKTKMRAINPSLDPHPLTLTGIPVRSEPGVLMTPMGTPWLFRG